MYLRVFLLHTSSHVITSYSIHYTKLYDDGGQFTGVSDLVSKYGLVPKEVMPETNSSENTSRMADLLSLKLREYGLQLRDEATKGAKPAALAKSKTQMLGKKMKAAMSSRVMLSQGIPMDVCS